MRENANAGKNQHTGVEEGGRYSVVLFLKKKREKKK
jgi:hypothetical protein